MIKKICIGMAMLPLVALAIVGGFTLWLTFATEPIDFNLDWEVDKGAVEESLRSAQVPLPPIWAPGGQHIVFNADNRMHAVDLSALSIQYFRPTQELSFEYAGSISSDGSIALMQHGYTHNEFGFRRRQEIETVEIDGANRRLLTTDNRSYSYYSVWSPDGDRIAFLATWNEEKRLHIMTVAEGDVAEISIKALDITAHLTPPVWSNRGRLIAFVGKEILDESGDYRHVIYVADRKAADYVRLAETESGPAWSPDDKRIAFVEHKDNVSTIYTVKADGANLRAIASFPDALPELEGIGINYPLGGLDRLPRGHVSWSSDGSEIRLHQSPFVVVNADGSNLRIMRGRPDALASWSPNESQIAVYMPGHATRLFTMAPDGSNKQSLVRWDNDAQEFVVDHRPLDIDGFDWERYPSPRVER